MSPRPTGRQLLALLALALVPLTACDDEEVPPLAWLVELEGPVRIDRAESAQGGEKDAPLYDGDWVSTGAGARASVRYSDRTQLSIGEHSRVRIGGSGGKLTLQLERGTLLSNTRQATSGGVTLLTPLGELQLMQGSELSFAVGAGGESKMEVLFGRIELLSKDGNRVSVLQGEILDLALGSKVSAPEPDAGPPPPAEALPIQLVLAAPRGKATLRPAGTQRFTPAPAEETPVAPGTAFKVAKAGTARVRGKGLTGQLGPASEGVIGAAELLGEDERYALSLESGNTELEFTHRGGRTVRLKSRGREVTLRSQDLGAVGVTVARRGLELVARAGKVTVVVGDQTRELSPGERVTLVGNVLGPTQRLSASLALPHSRRVRVYADKLGWVALQLPKRDGAVRVEVARDAEYTDRVLSGMVEDEQLIVPAPASGELYWRALGEDDTELAKGQARFTPDRGRSVIDLDNPRAEVTETGLKATVLFQSVPPSLTFSFAEKPEAASYRVRVFKAGELNKPVAEKVVKEPRATFEAGQLREGEYLWNATPLAATGGELSGGRMNRLELLYDNSRTSLAIGRPRMNEVVSAQARGVPVEGIAPVGSKLFVNGRPAALDAKGRFSTTVPRAQTLVFRLITENGSEGYWVRPLRRAR